MKKQPGCAPGVSAVVPEGSLFAIVGGNGAGKSTMLKAICGICKPYRGKIRVFGKKVEAYGGDGAVPELPGHAATGSQEPLL